MNITIPFSKDILFKSKIAEICSISLEQDVSINEKELLGDFIVSGEYKNLDINVDTLPFNHVVPFSVELEDDINFDTLSYEIVDFNYDVVNDDTLRVNISFHVEALKNERKIEEVFEKVDTNIDEYNNLIKESTSSEVVDSALSPDERNDDVDAATDSKRVLDVNVTANNNLDVNLFSNNDLSEDYITYHVHTVKLNETLDSISQEYNIPKDELINLNDTSNVNVGDKLIIPMNLDAE